jgi:hypothetical protein
MCQYTVTINVLYYYRLEEVSVDVRARAIIARMSNPGSPVPPIRDAIGKQDAPAPAPSPIAGNPPLADKVICERCGAAEMYRMHAVWRCPACGFKTDCCGW